MVILKQTYTFYFVLITILFLKTEKLVHLKLNENSFFVISRFFNLKIIYYFLIISWIILFSYRVK